MCKKHKFKKIAEGHCPICGSSKVNYDGSELNGDVMSYSCFCKDCETNWSEDFSLVFCGISNVYDKDGNQLGDTINLKGEEECPIE